MSLESPSRGAPFPDQLSASYDDPRPGRRGRLGRIFVARQIELDRDVFIRLLPLAHPALAEVRRRVEILASLNHPGIVPVVAMEEVGDDFFYALPFIANVDLEELSAHASPTSCVKPTTDKARRRALSDLVDALEALQGVGLVAGEVAESEVLITPDARFLLSEPTVAAATLENPGRKLSVLMEHAVGFVADPVWGVAARTGARNDPRALSATLLPALSRVQSGAGLDDAELLERVRRALVDSDEEDVTTGVAPVSSRGGSTRTGSRLTSRLILGAWVAVVTLAVGFGLFNIATAPSLESAAVEDEPRSEPLGDETATVDRVLREAVRSVRSGDKVAGAARAEAPADGMETMRVALLQIETEAQRIRRLWSGDRASAEAALDDLIQVRRRGGEFGEDSLRAVALEVLEGESPITPRVLACAAAGLLGGSTALDTALAGIARGTGALPNESLLAVVYFSHRPASEAEEHLEEIALIPAKVTHAPNSQDDEWLSERFGNGEHTLSGWLGVDWKHTEVHLRAVALLALERCGSEIAVSHARTLLRAEGQLAEAAVEVLASRPNEVTTGELRALYDTVRKDGARLALLRSIRERDPELHTELLFSGVVSMTEPRGFRRKLVSEFLQSGLGSHPEHLTRLCAGIPPEFASDIARSLAGDAASKSTFERVIAEASDSTEGFRLALVAAHLGMGTDWVHDLLDGVLFDGAAPDLDRRAALRSRSGVVDGRTANAVVDVLEAGDEFTLMLEALRIAGVLLGDTPSEVQTYRKIRVEGLGLWVSDLIDALISFSKQQPNVLLRRKAFDRLEYMNHPSIAVFMASLVHEVRGAGEEVPPEANRALGYLGVESSELDWDAASLARHRRELQRDLRRIIEEPSSVSDEGLLAAFRVLESLGVEDAVELAMEVMDKVILADAAQAILEFLETHVDRPEVREYLLARFDARFSVEEVQRLLVVARRHGLEVPVETLQELLREKSPELILEAAKTLLHQEETLPEGALLRAVDIELEQNASDTFYEDGEDGGFESFVEDFSSPELLSEIESWVEECLHDDFKAVEALSLLALTASHDRLRESVDPVELLDRQLVEAGLDFDGFVERLMREGRPPSPGPSSNPTSGDGRNWTFFGIPTVDVLCQSRPQHGPIHWLRGMLRAHQAAELHSGRADRAVSDPAELLAGAVSDLSMRWRGEAAPTEAIVYFLKCLDYTGGSRDGSARTLLEGTIEARPDDPMLRMAYVGRLRSAGEVERAHAIMVDVIHSDPVRYWPDLVDIRVAMGDVAGVSDAVLKLSVEIRGPRLQAMSLQIAGIIAARPDVASRLEQPARVELFDRCVETIRYASRESERARACLHISAFGESSTILAKAAKADQSADVQAAALIQLAEVAPRAALELAREKLGGHPTAAAAARFVVFPKERKRALDSLRKILPERPAPGKRYDIRPDILAIALAQVAEHDAVELIERAVVALSHAPDRMVRLVALATLETLSGRGHDLPLERIRQCHDRDVEEDVREEAARLLLVLGHEKTTSEARGRLQSAFDAWRESPGPVTSLALVAAFEPAVDASDEGVKTLLGSVREAAAERRERLVAAAVAVARAAIEAENTSLSWGNLGDLHDALGDRTAAKAAWEKARALAQGAERELWTARLNRLFVEGPSLLWSDDVREFRALSELPPALTASEREVEREETDPSPVPPEVERERIRSLLERLEKAVKFPSYPEWLADIVQNHSDEFFDDAPTVRDGWWYRGLLEASPRVFAAMTRSWLAFAHRDDEVMSTAIALHADYARAIEHWRKELE